MIYQIPNNIAYVDGAEFDQGEALYLTTLPSGRTVVLRDLARLVWVVAAQGGDVPAAVTRLDERASQATEHVVEDFLADLVARGLLATANRAE